MCVVCPIVMLTTPVVLSRSYNFPDLSKVNSSNIDKRAQMWGAKTPIGVSNFSLFWNKPWNMTEIYVNCILTLYYSMF